MTTTNEFWKKADEFGKLGRPTIAFGLGKPDPEILASLARSKELAEIMIVGPQAISSISGFRVLVDEQPEEKLASLLANGEVDGIVRGTIDDKKTLHAYQRLTGEVDRICPALMEALHVSTTQEHGQVKREITEKQFFLCPASNTDGWTKEKRLEEASETAAFVRAWGVRPKIAVYMAMRHQTALSGNPIVDRTRSDADWIVEELDDAGFEAHNVGIDLDEALAGDFNIHVPVNGMVGNQIFRALFFCGGRVLTATRIGFSRPYEDNARAEKDFQPHIRWLVGFINKKKYGSGVAPG
jgi:predicted methyltransferase MtxX (methanogen marker protein 4)